MKRIAPHFDASAYDRVMRARPGELDLRLDGDAVTGTIPDALWGGTFWSNGPGGLDLGGRVLHPFDGHGYVRALRFDRRGLRLQARYVRTDAYMAERDGVMRHRGLGSMLPGGPLANLRANQSRHVANTCVLPWAGRVLALWEGGRPYALDPETLETRDVESFGGALRPGEAFLAHTRFDAASGRLVGMTQRFRGLRTEVAFLEIDGKARVVSRRPLLADRLLVTHDFLITPRFYVLVENAVTLDVVGAVRMKLGLGPVLGAVRPLGEAARVWLLPRAGGAPSCVSLGRPLFTVHHVNAWEEDGRVVLVTCGFDRFRFGRELGYAGPDRPLDPVADQVGKVLMVRVDPTACTAEVAPVGRHAIDFPRAAPDADGQPTRDAWGASPSEEDRPYPFDAVAHLDLERRTSRVWRAGAGRFVGEPLVAPPFVLAMVSDAGARASTLVILDGRDVTAGPVAAIRLPVLLPYGFHGFWQPKG